MSQLTRILEYWLFQAEKARLEVARIEKEKKMAQEEAKRAEEAERKKAALAALNVKQGPKTGTISRPTSDKVHHLVHHHS